jgi:hypothetical protein
MISFFHLLIFLVIYLFIYVFTLFVIVKKPLRIVCLEKIEKKMIIAHLHKFYQGPGKLNQVTQVLLVHKLQVLYRTVN